MNKPIIYLPIINIALDDLLQDKRVQVFNQYSIKIVREIFPKLNEREVQLLADHLALLLYFINLKFGPGFWVEELLEYNGSQDLKSLAYMMFPYLKTDVVNIYSLEELYLKKQDDRFVYTDAQYSRFLLTPDNKIYYRPFIPEYFRAHFRLLLNTIDALSHKLMVNWVHIVPVPLDQFSKTQLYKETKGKLKRHEIRLLDGFIDIGPGISYADIYHVIANHLYHEVKNCKWLIYDIRIGGNLYSYINYLKNKIHLKPIINNQSWDSLGEPEREVFGHQWAEFMGQENMTDLTIKAHFFYFFAKYYRTGGQIILKMFTEEQEELEESLKIDLELVRKNQDKIKDIPIEDIYQFLFDQISILRSGWYRECLRDEQVYLTTDNNLYVTFKNIFNYAKSMVHYNFEKYYYHFPNNWYSLNPKWRDIFLIRLLDIEHPQENNWKIHNWFNINNYFRKIYGLEEYELIDANYKLHQLIHPILLKIVFESLIYHGLLSHPKNDITLLDKKTSTTLWRRLLQKRLEEYGNASYSYVDGRAYRELRGGQYLKLLPSENWSRLYAVHWTAQINFFHHFMHNRMILITGSTGVGKSTQTPKLAFYALKMLYFQRNARVVCSQPRIEPTVLNADTISREMGYPIFRDDRTRTIEYYIQFRHHADEHWDPNIKSFFRLETDGLLYDEVTRYPFMTGYSIEPVTDKDKQAIKWYKKFHSENIYDVIIVDEAHEHNVNMDMILTLSREMLYINNSIRLIIMSATMDEDEPRYRRFYRYINNNVIYPLSYYLKINRLDRSNVDLRVHVNAPGSTTLYRIIDHYLSPQEAQRVNEKTYVLDGIRTTLEILRRTQEGHILLFLAGKSDILEAVRTINRESPPNVICFGYYSELNEAQKEFIRRIDQNLPLYTGNKENVLLDEELKNVQKAYRVRPGTYNRAVIAATNIAEASITISNLKYVVDTGYAKINIYDPIEDTEKLILTTISWTSAQQRRGRVGRTQDGEVYHRYNLEKILKNRQIYQITNIRPDILILRHLITDHRDIIINNDFLLYDKYKLILEYLNGAEYIYPEIVHEIEPYVEIILKKYMLLPNFKLKDAYYAYLGKFTIDDQYINVFNNNYYAQNHDDYPLYDDYIYNDYLYICFTGIKLNISFIENKKVNLISNNFYLISPDENIIIRNPFTGSVINLQGDQLTNPQYLKEFSEIEVSQKILSAMRRLYHNNLVTIYQNNVDNFIILPNGTLISTGLLNEEIEIKTVLGDYIYRLMHSLNFGLLSDYECYLWLVYSFQYNIEEDVLALLEMMETVPDVYTWRDQNITEERFKNLHSNSWGDLYFLCYIWFQLKRALQDTIDRLDPDKLVRVKYAHPQNQYKMYKLLRLKEESKLSQTTLQKIQIVVKFNMLNEKLVINFIQNYLKDLFELRRMRKLAEYDPENDNIFKILEKSSSIKGRSTVPFPEIWKFILSTFIAAYYNNINSKCQGPPKTLLKSILFYRCKAGRPIYFSKIVRPMYPWKYYKNLNL